MAYKPLHSAAAFFDFIALLFILVGLIAFEWFLVDGFWYGLRENCTWRDTSAIFQTCYTYNDVNSGAFTGLLVWPFPGEHLGVGTTFSMLYTAGTVAFVFLTVGGFFVMMALAFHLMMIVSPAVLVSNVGGSYSTKTNSGFIRSFLTTTSDTLGLFFTFLGFLLWIALFPYPNGGVSEIGYGFILVMIAIVLLLIAVVLSRRAQGEYLAYIRKERPATAQGVREVTVTVDQA